MSELLSLRYGFGSEQDADISVELGDAGPATPPRTARLAVGWQIPPELLLHAFAAVDVAVDRLLTGAGSGALEAQATGDLFGCPAGSDVIDDPLAEMRISDQLPLAGATVGRADLRRHGKVAAHLWHIRIVEVVAPDLTEDGGTVALEDPRHFFD